MKDTTKLKRLLKNTGITLLLPCVVLAIMLVACAIKGVPFWAAQGGLRAFLYSLTISAFSAFALSLHLYAGRFDFSLGSISALSTIISGQIALALNLNAFTMLLVFLVVGAVLGLISGLLYLLFNLPPIITSLGVALAYEGLSFVLSGGRGVSIALYPNLLGGAGITQMLALLVVVLVVMIVLLNFTRFGYNYRAIQFGQKISVETGLNEKSNALVCYILCGALVAVVGFLKISYNGSQAPALSLSTSGAILSAMLPLFIGGLISRYCEQNICVVIGCLTSSFITQGLTSLGVSGQTRSLITSFLMILILMYSTNSYKLKEAKMKRIARKTSLTDSGVA